MLVTILTDIGIDAQLDFQQAATFNERWQAGDFDMFLHGSVVDADPDDGHWNIFHSTGPWNTYGYKSAKADELLEATRATSDQAERARLFGELPDAAPDRRRGGVHLSHPGSHRPPQRRQGLRGHPEQRYYEKVWLER